MWSENLKNGNVRYVERYEHPMTGKMIKLPVTMDKDTRSNRKIAESTLCERFEKKFRDISLCSKKEQLTLSELVELYRADQKGFVAPSTYRRNYHTANTLMKILGKDTLVDRLTAGYVRKNLMSNDPGPGTVNERLIRLKALLRWAYNNDYLSDIRWLDKVKPVRDERKADKLDCKFLESSDLRKLLDAMTITKWRFLAELTALSGLRAGEAIALEREDVDTVNRVIHVTKTYDSNNEAVTAPKTKTSIREVYMQDELLSLCCQIKAYMNREKLSQGYHTKLFLCDRRGEHMAYYAYNKYLRETSKKVLGRAITSHYMRHTHVALMAEQEVSLDIISRRLGHADSRITRDIYFHVTDKLKEKENKQIKAVKLL